VKPHPELQQHYQSSTEKPRFIKDLFDKGAPHYDRVVKWGFWGSGDFYRRWTLQRNGLRPGMKLLDVACGTGLVALAASKILGGASEITCVDPSDGMLAEAKKKVDARFVKAGGESMPVPAEGFDFLTLGYALRHFQDLEAAFREFHRVLKPGGKVLILEVTKPDRGFLRWLFRVYFGKLYPGFSRLITRSRDAEKMMVYYWETMDACVPPADVLAALQAAGFQRVKRQVLAGLFSEYTAVK
jgi:demethylmenaquinone methyltransferase / 2-methoxy-6-polyprenyl-1,4-benzoquinol methylase